MTTIKLNEPISVSFTFDGVKKAIFPRALVWKGRLHAIKKVGLHHKFRQGKTIVTLDMKNAYNTILRGPLADTVYNMELPYIHRMMNLVYGVHSLLLYRSPLGPTEIPSQCGVRQGDVLGPVLFSLGIQGILVECIRKFPNVECRAYLDDITLTGNNRDLIQATNFLIVRLENIGLVANRSKCFFLTEDDRMAADLLQLRFERSLRCIKLLGAYIGDPKAEREALTSKKQKYGEFFDLLTKGLIQRHAVYLLVLNCGLPKLNYYVRTHHEWVTKDLCSFFDQQILSVLRGLLDEPLLGPLHLMQINLPIASGGFGLRSYVRLAPVAYTASTTAVAAKQGSIVPSQHELMEKIDATCLKTLMDRSTTTQKARILSSSTSLSFLRILDLVDDATFLVSARHRLGLPHINAHDYTCACGQLFTSIDIVPHVECCKHISGYTWQTRHDDILKKMKPILREAGFTVEDITTQYAQDPTDGRIPDLYIAMDAFECSIDLTIVCPTGKGVVNHSSVTPGYTAAQAEIAKTEKHGDNAKLLHHHFYPVVMETYGLFGAQTFKWLNDLRRVSKVRDLPGRIVTCMNRALHVFNGRLLRRAIKTDTRGSFTAPRLTHPHNIPLPSLDPSFLHPTPFTSPPP